MIGAFLGGRKADTRIIITRSLHLTTFTVFIMSVNPVFVLQSKIKIIRGNTFAEL